MLSHFISTRHPEYKKIKAFVNEKIKDIPTYAYQPPSPTASLESYLAKEFFQACNETRPVKLVILKGKKHSFFKHSLRRIPLYWYVRDYTKNPLGLAVEYLLHEKKIKCPVSGNELVANGGAAGAWCDLTCPSSKVNVEVKTKWDMRRAYPNLNGGSYRWYKAQKAANVKNYVVVVPRKGGAVFMCDIKKVFYRIDNKFCAFYNSKWRNEATLRSYVKLKDPKVVLNIEKLELDKLEMESREFMLELWCVYFGSKARKIQRLWKKYKKIKHN